MTEYHCKLCFSSGKECSERYYAGDKPGEVRCRHDAVFSLTCPDLDARGERNSTVPNGSQRYGAPMLLVAAPFWREPVSGEFHIESIEGYQAACRYLDEHAQADEIEPLAEAMAAWQECHEAGNPNWRVAHVDSSALPPDWRVLNWPKLTHYLANLSDGETPSVEGVRFERVEP